jgi:hypothetical protein
MEPVEIVLRGERRMSRIIEGVVKTIEKIIYHEQVRFIPGTPDWFNICESINRIQHVNRTRNTQHMIISSIAKKQ